MYVEVERLGSGMRVDAGRQKSMTSVENRDPVRKYSPGGGELVAQSEMAELMMRVKAGCQEEDGKGGRNGYTEGRRLGGEEYQEDLVVGTL